MKRDQAEEKASRNRKVRKGWRRVPRRLRRWVRVRVRVVVVVVRGGRRWWRVGVKRRRVVKDWRRRRKRSRPSGWFLLVLGCCFGGLGRGKGWSEGEGGVAVWVGLEGGDMGNGLEEV